MEKIDRECTHHYTYRGGEQTAGDERETDTERRERERARDDKDRCRM